MRKKSVREVILGFIFVLLVAVFGLLEMFEHKAFEGMVMFALAYIIVELVME